MALRKLSPFERHLLRTMGLSPESFLSLGKTASNINFIDRKTGKVLAVRY